MIADQAAGACRRSLHELSTAYSECPGTLRRSRQLGLSGWAFHVAGRAGALGPVTAQTVAAAIGFIAPDAVTEGWDAACAVSTPQQVATVAMAECCRWGVERLGEFTGVDRLVELASPVVRAADATAMPLFAAWRAMPRPDESAGAQAAVAVRLLSEHRSGAHLLAVRVAGLTPVEAILSGPEGPNGAVAAGWSPPWPPVGPLIRRRLWADQVTNRLAGQAFTVIDPAQRRELVTLLADALAHIQPTT
ncbi:SCO6745 family protein [Solwaraspora sp. WMMB335]|uniref:SCO6745 family protein n=1 Tax=Solwaraspora sp. WMMB335 TaxID=3404118 RepID=UPI003B9307B0